MLKRVARIALAWFVVAMVVAPTAKADLPPDVPYTSDNPNRFAVENVPAVKRLLSHAATRRIDFALIGDSNVFQQTVSGHADGMGRALGERFGLYATRVDPVAGWGSYAAPVFDQVVSAGAPFQSNGGPPEVIEQVFSDTAFPGATATLAAGEETVYHYNYGLSLLPAHLIDISAPLKFHLTDWCFGEGSQGVFNVSIRAAYPGNAFVNYASFPPTPTAGPVVGWVDHEFALAAGPRSPYGVLFCLANAADVRVARGPLAVSWQRVENTSRETGIAYSVLWARGGHSARSACVSLRALSSAPAPVKEWMRQATRLQGGPATLAVQIIHGGNDVGDVLPSAGPISGIPSNTPEGHLDNLLGIIGFLRQWWTEAGYDPENLYFILGPYHPQADRLDLVRGYEQVWRTLAETDPQIIAVAGTRLSTPQEFDDRGWYASTADRAHLSIPGFRAWGTTFVRALGRAACPPDFDENGESEVADIFAFLNAWFSGSISADFDVSGQLQTQDIFEYLNAWFGGCP